MSRHCQHSVSPEHRKARENFIRSGLIPSALGRHLLQLTNCFTACRAWVSDLGETQHLPAESGRAAVTRTWGAHKHLLSACEGKAGWMVDVQHKMCQIFPKYLAGLS